MLKTCSGDTSFTQAKALLLGMAGCWKAEALRDSTSMSVLKETKNTFDVSLLLVYVHAIPYRQS